ncbi:P2X purinoceptor 2 (P2X2) (ATP receptor) (Purinergic receptor) [Durusdinium trenchii]|uniref:P2X purinoceptor 2 (P2X2) (ATP receptor) (Purinergic receptor) n=1 Tax=Durusdinium trenchii TaxID=1381693 RepID=A0ABP0RIW3_9DINO
MELLGASEDPDKLCSYSTKQQVEIRDKWLGILQCSMQTAMVTYIVFGIFIYNQGYLDYEPSRGAIATHVHGDFVAVSSGRPKVRYFTAEEITTPGLENGNVFVTTRQSLSRQKRGVCEDQEMPCEGDEDCHSQFDGKCSQKGFCIEPSWCPMEDADETYELDAVADLAIWVKSSIQFVGMAPDKVWSTETDHAYPEPGYNLFTVRDLLLLCDPTPVRFEEISKLGAAIEVQFVWNCHINNDKCKPEVKVRRLDTLFDEAQFGYFFNDAEYISEDERFLKKVNGVRIFLRTVGVGHRLSVIKLVMKASTAGTLLTVAPLIADLLMLQALALRKRYFARKYEVSPDFSEYMVQLMAKKEEENRLPGMLAEDDAAALERDQDWHRRLEEHD